jgi:hypothetical protein
MFKSKAPIKPLSYDDVYPCPVCRHGEIANLSLMEAFACNSCRHIFTANLEQESLKLADSQIPLTWSWNGRTWQGVKSQDLEWSWAYWLGGTIFVILPTTIVGLSAYLFPALPGSRLFWFPTFWTGLTFISHLACLVWLILEYYQFPVWLYIRASLQRIFLQGRTSRSG